MFQITEVPGHSEPFKPFLVLCSCDVSVTSPPKTPNSGRSVRMPHDKTHDDLYEVLLLVPLAGREGGRNERLKFAWGSRSWDG